MLCFLNQWDLGEDLLIARTPSGVAVSGTASSGGSCGIYAIDFERLAKRADLYYRACRG